MARKRLSPWEEQVEIDRSRENTIAQWVAKAIWDHGDGDPNGLMAKIAVAVLRAKAAMEKEDRAERRRQRRHVSLEDVEPEPAVDHRRHAELLDLCRVILVRLADVESQVLEMSFAAGMTRSEIAKTIGRSVRAVSHIRSRAIAKARQIPGVSPRF